MHPLLSLYGRFLNLLGVSAGVILAAIATLIAVDVVLRNLGLGNLPWLIEVAEYALYVTTFMAAPWVLHQGGHVRVDVFVAALPHGVARKIDVGVNALGLLICAVLVYYGAAAAHDAYAIGAIIFKELVIPEWPLLSVVPLAGSLLCVEFVLRLMGMVADQGNAELGDALGREGH